MNSDFLNEVTLHFLQKYKPNSVSYGHETKKGERTGRITLIFSVNEKTDNPEGKKIPKAVQYKGVKFNTDVVERKIIPTVCVNEFTQNLGVVRPIRGGIGIQPEDSGSDGTLGFIAVDNNDGALVGVGNAHVLYDADARTPSIRTEDDVVISNAENVYVLQPQLGDDIGSLKRCIYLNDDLLDTTDAACFSVREDVISATLSWKQAGLEDLITTPPTFATTAELDNILTTDPPLYRSARATGVLGDAVGDLRVVSMLQAITVPYENLGSLGDITLRNIITYEQYDPDTGMGCPITTISGDSGSAVLAEIGGEIKIIGLSFAAAGSQALLCRIDEIAEKLDISAWDGTITTVTDDFATEAFTTSDILDDPFIIVDGERYYNAGQTSREKTSTDDILESTTERILFSTTNQVLKTTS